MKRNSLTLTIGGLLVVIFGFQLCSFQVRQTEVALVTTFGKPTRNVTEPGLKGKWPWPIQRVLKFDKRIQSFEDKYEQSLTRDGRNLVLTVYAGWSISDPSIFRERFVGSISRAETELASVIRNAKSAVVGQHPFSHFVSTDQNELKFSQIETNMLAQVRSQAKNYGVDINYLGIKRLGLPESATEKVFARMMQDRYLLVTNILGQANQRASDIRSEANRQRAEYLAEAEARVTELQGEAEAKAAESLAVFEKNPELAIFRLQLKALEETLKERSTLILDQRTPPFNLLDGSAAAASSPPGNTSR